MDGFLAIEFLMFNFFPLSSNLVVVLTFVWSFCEQPHVSIDTGAGILIYIPLSKNKHENFVKKNECKRAVQEESKDSYTIIPI